MAKGKKKKRGCLGSVLGSLLCGPIGMVLIVALVFGPIREFAEMWIQDPYFMDEQYIQDMCVNYLNINAAAILNAPYEPNIINMALSDTVFVRDDHYIERDFAYLNERHFTIGNQLVTHRGGEYFCSDCFNVSPDQVETNVYFRFLGQEGHADLINILNIARECFNMDGGMAYKNISELGGSKECLTNTKTAGKSPAMDSDNTSRPVHSSSWYYYCPGHTVEAKLRCYNRYIARFKMVEALEGYGLPWQFSLALVAADTLLNNRTFSQGAFGKLTYVISEEDYNLLVGDFRPEFDFVCDYFDFIDEEGFEGIKDSYLSYYYHPYKVDEEDMKNCDGLFSESSICLTDETFEGSFNVVVSESYDPSYRSQRWVTPTPVLMANGITTYLWDYHFEYVYNSRTGEWGVDTAKCYKVSRMGWLLEKLEERGIDDMSLLIDLIACFPDGEEVAEEIKELYVGYLDTGLETTVSVKEKDVLLYVPEITEHEAIFLDSQLPK